MIETPIMSIKLLLPTLLKYAVTGATGGVIQVGILAWWVEMVFHGDPLKYRGGVILGFCAALAITFTMQKFWTFQSRDYTGAPRQFVLYSLIAMGSLICNERLMFFFVERMGMWYIAAQLITIAIVAGISFMLNYGFTFRSPSSPVDPSR